MLIWHINTHFPSSAIFLGTVLQIAGVLFSNGYAQSAAATYPHNTLLTPEKEKALFNGLDLSGDALQSVREAVDRNDYDTAQHLLADYFRKRTSPVWKFDPHNPDRATSFNRQMADDAVRGHVKGGQIPVYADFPDGKIIWTYNETLHHPGTAPNVGWPGQLTRADFWEDMAAAYRATGDEKYAKAWALQMRSFIEQCPPPAEVPPMSPPTGWVPIDVGCRLGGSWPDAFYSFIASPSLSDEDVLVFVYGFLIHGQWLSTHHGPGNGLMIERTALYTMASLFPEFKQSAQWRDEAIKGQMAQAAAQFLPDGAEDEISTGYQNVAIDAILGIPAVAKIVGRTGDLPPEYNLPMERAEEFNMYMSAPDRQIPKFNDSWSTHVQGVMKGALSYFPDRQDFLWFATDGKQGSPPAETSKAFDYAGLYAMRSSWDINANYLAFRDGPFIFSHGHQDKLTVVMWAYGREILFNSGGGPYDGSKWRQYSIDTFSKNTVLVDGLPQHRPRNLASNSLPKIDSRWESTPDHDFVAGSYNEAYGAGLHPATHVRRVLFLKPDLAVVADTLTPNDASSHTYQARWNLLTTNTKQIEATHEIVTTDPGVPNLSIVPLNPDGLDVRSATGQLQPELLGWNVVHYTVSQPAAATTVVQTRQGTGVQIFLNLLVPIPSATSDPVKSVESTGAGKAKVTFNDGRFVEIVADPNPAAPIEITETLADGGPGRHVIAGESKP